MLVFIPDEQNVILYTYAFLDEAYQGFICCLAVIWLCPCFVHTRVCTLDVICPHFCFSYVCVCLLVGGWVGGGGGGGEVEGGVCNGFSLVYIS